MKDWEITPRHFVTNDKLGPMRRKIRYLYDSEHVRFLAVGGFNTGFGYLLFAGLVLTLSEYIHYTVLLVMAYAVATVVAYVLHRSVVFRARGNLVKDLPRYCAVHVGVIGANLVILPVLVDLVGIPVLIAQALLVAVSAVGSFLGHKYFSFARSRKQESLASGVVISPSERILE